MEVKHYYFIVSVSIHDKTVTQMQKREKRNYELVTQSMLYYFMFFSIHHF